MNKTIEYRELTADVPNPLRDKRAKYGIESVDGFTKGTRFGLVAHPEAETTAYFDLRLVYTPNRGLIKTLTENSVLATPRTARELLFARDPGAPGISAALAELVEILVEQGRITLADVEAADVERDRRYRANEGRAEKATEGNG